jgi:hypothetical protein
MEENALLFLIKYGLLAILILVGMWIVARLFFKAAFKSYFEAKSENKDKGGS